MAAVVVEEEEEGGERGNSGRVMSTNYRGKKKRGEGRKRKRGAEAATVGREEARGGRQQLKKVPKCIPGGKRPSSSSHVARTFFGREEREKTSVVFPPSTEST